MKNRRNKTPGIAKILRSMATMPKGIPTHSCTLRGGCTLEKIQSEETGTNPNETLAVALMHA
jgi:hypothetical protein